MKKSRSDIVLTTMFSGWFFAALLLYGWFGFLFFLISFTGYSLFLATNRSNNNIFIESASLAFGISCVASAIFYTLLYVIPEFQEEIPNIKENFIKSYLTLMLIAPLPTGLLLNYSYSHFKK